MSHPNYMIIFISKIDSFWNILEITIYTAKRNVPGLRLNLTKKCRQINKDTTTMIFVVRTKQTEPQSDKQPAHV